MNRNNRLRILRGLILCLCIVNLKMEVHAAGASSYFGTYGGYKWNIGETSYMGFYLESKEGNLTEVELTITYDPDVLELKNKDDSTITLLEEGKFLIKQKGDFGKKPDDVNAFAASTFYCVDRYASFKANWGEFYLNGGTVIAGRYTTSNAVHQCSKLPESEWESFLEWLYDFEYQKVAIPKPDKVIFLDMPIEVSQKLLTGRYNGDETKKDIHESDTEYLARCRKAALFTAKYSGWEIIPCAENGNARSIESIQQDVLKACLSIYSEVIYGIFVFSKRI